MKNDTEQNRGKNCSMLKGLQVQNRAVKEKTKLKTRTAVRNENVMVSKLDHYDVKIKQSYISSS